MTSIDLANSDGNSAESEVARALHALSTRPLDLSSPSLFDVSVMKLAEHAHVLALTMHHMLTDLTSLSLVFRELWHTYSNLALGRNYPLADVSFQYTDYAIWQRGNSRDWEGKSRRYWDDKLRDTSRIPWPLHGRSRVTRRNSLGEQAISVGERLTAEVFDRARKLQTTPAMMVLACYAVALRHWCRQNTFVVPFNISGRDRVELTDMIGPLGQMLFIKVTMSGQETFSDLVAIVSEEFQTAHDHLDFAKLSMESPELLKSGFLQWLPWNPAERAGMSASDWDACSGRLGIRSICPKRSLANASMEYDVVLQLLNSSQGIRGTCWYRADLFSMSTIAELLRDLVRILERSVHYPQERIANW
jgi:hypothetical protein